MFTTFPLPQASADGIERPIIFITGIGEVPTSVKTMKAGAVDSLTKPVKSQVLLAAITAAFEKESGLRERREYLATVHERLARLTARETEVLTHVVAGRLNKQIAAQLGIAEKTVKLHRGRMMRKLGVRALAELVRIADCAGIRRAP